MIAVQVTYFLTVWGAIFVVFLVSIVLLLLCTMATYPSRVRNPQSSARSSVPFWVAILVVLLIGTLIITVFANLLGWIKPL